MYRTVAQLDSLTAALAALYPSTFTRVTLPEPSVNGHPVHALRIRAGGGPDRRAVLIVGGTHARELMNPDAIVELAVDLLVSHLTGSDISYGGRTWKADDVKLILRALDIWMVPCINPDGRAYVMTTDDLWRKNRRDNPGPCDGVDLNRNLDVLWGVAQGNTSCSPCADVYCGTSVFSEPETRNVRYLLDAHPMVSFVDVHSYSELVLYPWGHAPTQTIDATQRFTGLPTGTCTPSIPASYAEYMEPIDEQRFTTVAGRIATSIQAVRGRTYTPKTGRALYPTTGTHSDYAYSRHIANPAVRKTYGFTFETGPWAGSDPASFHPADPTLIKLDAQAGLLALLEQSVCAIELIGLTQAAPATDISAIRRVRSVLADSEAGRRWISLFERVQWAALTAVVADEALATTAADVVETVARLVADDQSMFRRTDSSQAAALLDQIALRCDDPAVQADLLTVSSKVRRLAGRSTRQVIDTVTTQRPRRPSTAAQLRAIQRAKDSTTMTAAPRATELSMR